MYSFISAASYIIRTFFLPNPFDCFGAQAFWINMFAGAIMYPLAYALTGTIYRRGDGAAIGSALYFLFYFLIHSILMLLGKFSFAWWSIALLIIALVLFKITIDKLFRYN